MIMPIFGLVLETGIAVTVGSVITTAAALIIAEFLLENPQFNEYTYNNDQTVTFSKPTFYGRITYYDDYYTQGFNSFENQYEGDIPYGNFKIFRSPNTNGEFSFDGRDIIIFGAPDGLDSYQEGYYEIGGLQIQSAFLENLDTGESFQLDLDNGGNLQGMSDLVLDLTIQRDVTPTIADVSKDIKQMQTQITQIFENTTVIRQGDNITQLTEITEVNNDAVMAELAGLRPFIAGQHAQTQAHVTSQVGQVLTLNAGISATLDLLTASEADRFSTLTGLINGLAIEPPEVDLSEVIARLEALFQQGVEHGTDIRYGVTLDEQILTDLTGLITEIGELETPDIDLSSIQQRLEQIFQQGSATQDDVRLAAGVIDSIFDLSTQILTEAEKIKQDTEKCAAEEDEEDENCCEEVREILERISATNDSNYQWFESCDAEQPQQFEMGGVAFGGILSAVREVLNRLNEVNRNLCGFDTVAAVPEGWPLRPESNRAQLIVILDILVDGRWEKQNRQIAIPHYNGGQTLPDITYTTGNFYAMLVLNDNSKVRVYASSMGAAEGVCEQIRGMIDGAYLTNSFITTGQVKRQIQQHEVRSRVAKFYAAGAAPGTAPQWTVRRPKDE